MQMSITTSSSLGQLPSIHSCWRMRMVRLQWKTEGRRIHTELNVRRRREDCPSSLEHVLDDSHSVIDRVPRRHVRAYIEACSAMNEEPIDAYIHCSRNERHCDHCRTLQNIEMKIAENDHHKAETVRYKLDSSLSRYFSTAIIPYLSEISRLGEVGMTRTLRSQVIWTILIQTTSQEEGSQ